MTDTKHLINEIYSAFNHRNIDAALDWMTDDVQWPTASEGGRVTGKEEIRAYWTRQWAEFDPHVEPTGITEREHGVEVAVHQIVKDLHGKVLSDQTVTHVYTVVNGRVARMEIKEESVPAFGR